MVLRKLKKIKQKQVFQKRAQVTKDAILIAAAHVLAEEGLLAFNTNRVAEKAGVSIGSLYQYYKNKESILEELVKENMDRRIGHFTELLKPSTIFKSPKEVVRALVEAAIGTPSFDPRLDQILFEQAHLILKKERIQSVDAVLIPVMKFYLKQRFAKLRKKDLDLALFVIMQASRGVVALSNAEGFKRHSRAAIVDELTDLVYRYLSE